MRGVFEMPEGLSGDCEEVLRRVVRVDPGERPSAEEMKGMRWLRGTVMPIGMPRCNDDDFGYRESVVAMMSNMLCISKR